MPPIPIPINIPVAQPAPGDRQHRPGQAERGDAAGPHGEPVARGQRRRKIARGFAQAERRGEGIRRTHNGFQEPARERKPPGIAAHSLEQVGAGLFELSEPRLNSGFGRSGDPVDFVAIHTHMPTVGRCPL